MMRPGWKAVFLGLGAVAAAAILALCAMAWLATRDYAHPAAPVSLASLPPATKGAQAPTTPLLPALVPFNGNACYTGPVPTPGRHTTITVADCAPPPPSTCPAGRQTTAQVCYQYGPSGCINSDVTRFETLWGRNSASDNTLDLFPGNQVFAIVKNFQKSQYIAAKFVAPAGPMNLYGLMYTTATTSGPPTTFAISTNCGDFTPTDTRCRLASVLPGEIAVAWKLPGYPGPALCPLTPGQTYYLNLKITNPAVTHFDCSGSTCKVGVTNNHTP